MLTRYGRDWARASVGVQRHEREHRTGDPGGYVTVAGTAAGDYVE